MTLEHSPAAGDRLSGKTIGYTEGGEALLQETGTDSWYALWTHSHCEQLVYEQLLQKGFCASLPMVDVWSRRRGVRRLIRTPMFPSYLFLRGNVDKSAYLEVTKCRGVVTMLGESWDRLTSIPDDEIDAIDRVSATRQPVLPYPYLKEGQRARITGGPLTGVEGILVESRPEQGLLVLSLHLLHRSVAVVIDGTAVVPA